MPKKIKNKKKRYLLILLVLALLCTGCAKQPSSFVPVSSYVYDDSQDVNIAALEEQSVDRDQADENSLAKMIKNPEAEQLEQSGNYSKKKDAIQSDDPVGSEDTNRQVFSDGPLDHSSAETERENAKEKRQKDEATIKDAFKNEGLSEDFGNVIDQNGKSWLITGTDQGDKTRLYPDQDGRKSGNIPGEDEEKQSIEEQMNAEPQEELIEKDEPGSGNDQSKVDGAASNSAEEKEQKGGEEKSEITLDPKKVISLSYEGELGTYIWGEAINLSALTVKARFEDGHEETITDYTIDMNYPGLNDPGVYSYEKIGPPLTVDTYVPGNYSATIGYQGATLEVPYTLIILYANLLVDHNAECKDPEGHNASLDEYGHYRCNHTECSCPSANPNERIIGEGHLVYVPLLYDYTFTADDLCANNFFNRGVNLGSYIFEGFPAVYDKNSASPRDGYGVYQYFGFGSTCRIIGYDYLEFRGDKPMYDYSQHEIESEETE